MQHAQNHGIRVYFDTTPAALDALVRQLRPDCVVVSSYNRILGREILKICRFINVHYAPLPRYRGRACVNWAIINGERCTAITIHELAPDLDAGNVLFQRLIPIGESDTVTAIYKRLNEIQKRHLGETVGRYLGGDKGSVQLDVDATYGCTRLPEDGEIDWMAATRTTYALIRGLTDPFPGAHTYLEGRRIVIWRAEPLSNPMRYSGRIPGRVIAISPIAGHVDVLTGDGVLRLLEVELEGGIRGPAADVIKSVRITLGMRMGYLLDRITRLEEQIKQLTQARDNISRE